MRSAGVEPLRWAGNHLELLDQRLLPLEESYLVLRDAHSTAQAIRAMVVRGAPAIGVTAAYGIALEAQVLAHSGCPVDASTLATAFDVLARSRPTAVNLAWALDRMREVLVEPARPGDAAAALLARARRLHGDDIADNRRLGAHGAELLPEHCRILTHCNAGALATCGYGTALGVVRAAVETGKRVSVLANETRPFLQGARLTAWELARDSIPVTIISDGMSGHLMAQGEIDAVIVGADRVAANGDVANKIGTYMVAVLAQRHGIPFYVACPCSTIDGATEAGDGIPIEERDAAEVLGWGAQRWAPPGVAARHPAFDITPAGLVTALITEAGVLRPPLPAALQAAGLTVAPA